MKPTPPYEISNDEHGVGEVFILRSLWQDSYGALMLDRGIEAFRIPGAGYGYQADSIDFVGELDFLRSVEIYHWDISDFTSVSKLHNIEVFGFQAKKATGLANWRPQLRVLLATWIKQLEPLLSLSTLEYVNISNYPYSDLTPINSKKLRRLYLTSRKLESLHGVEDFPELQQVDLYSCPNLKSIEGLESLKSLNTLEVESCRHISKDRVVTHFNK